MRKSINSPEYRKLLSWLKAARQERGLSMRELADALDVPHSWISKIETGERRLDVLEFVTYCQALKLDPKVGLSILS